MSIAGIGTDIVEINRIKDQDDFIQRLAARVLTAEELTEFEAAKFKKRFLAKRWAAKEAVAKAFGTGIGKQVSFQDITVTHDNLGKPELLFTGGALALCQSRNINSSHVSIADEERYATAMVVLENG